MLPTTTSVLLEALLDDRRSQSDGTWLEFDRRYRPVLFSFARKLGLLEQDAADVAQDALVRFVEEFRAGKFDRGRGRLRSWLFAITRTRVDRFRRSRAQSHKVGGESVLAELPGEDELSELWESEWRRAVLSEGMNRLRASSINPSTLRAFERVSLDGLAPSAVAADLGMSTNAVYLAKFRVLERLRAVLVTVDEDWS